MLSSLKAGRLKLNEYYSLRLSTALHNLLRLKKPKAKPLLSLITASHLPFLFLKHQEFTDVIKYARLTLTTLTIPSRRTIRERLKAFINKY
ncbi:hypothetical protein N7447_006751 [Penicillium robsamsonii]|uniref:uncharacterized protein n=1 Tax=Penicillium robsamsonii TaxID=1792511 RepID=UPI0025479F6F|nr:uncharacterized protein N7447_006751 [Penicillium robsamsonii]KAJ5824411.1 hypothetical protein N7447_006751 [Penicillium robsamsonii]